MERMNLSKELMDAIYEDTKINYMLVNEDVLKDKNISFTAKGILCFLLSYKFKKGDDYQEILKTYTKENKKSIISGIKELKNNGYLKWEVKNGKDQRN